MDVACDVIRSRRRSICLEITRDARLVVRAPLSVSDAYVRRLVRARKDWIERTLGIMRLRVQRRPERQFIDGETLLYLGNEYPLRIVDGQALPLVFDNAFSIERGYACMARRLLTAWYRAQAQRLYSERLAVAEERCGLRCTGLTLSDARSRWGCCAPAGDISLSWRLSMAPLVVIDYVILHELAHLVHRNHSGRFWRTVAAFFPGYKEQRDWLKENGPMLVV